MSKTYQCAVTTLRPILDILDQLMQTLCTFPNDTLSPDTVSKLSITIWSFQCQLKAISYRIVSLEPLSNILGENILKKKKTANPCNIIFIQAFVKFVKLMYLHFFLLLNF